MGLSAGVVYISEPNVGLAAAVSLGLVRGDALPITSSEDSGFPSDNIVRVASWRDWSAVVAGTEIFIPIEKDLSSSLASLSIGRRVFCWVTQSTAGCVLFEFHDNGKLCRKWSECEGQILEEIGAPLLEEAGLVDMSTYECGPIHDEWSMLRLAQALVGLSEDEHFELQGTSYPTNPDLIAPPSKKKPWWKVW